ncbi:hypothetical protein ABL78_5218 [Leptomonas seymouri]|uniref:DUF7883 domain-containing protein n=1 Tax=Leptomonas seymouri TaxID=5684 RepID=A0A0N1I3S2_LEPSE|nr:hypothetical protein ABL78_5218 [Leptomonas seymouri]|eukprot:KPI85731.1 hypothetical protein ABL78_5218 [Leptomonas seymouri]
MASRRSYGCGSMSLYATRPCTPFLARVSFSSATPSRFRTTASALYPVDGSTPSSEVSPAGAGAGAGAASPILPSLMRFWSHASSTHFLALAASRRFFSWTQPLLRENRPRSTPKVVPTHMESLPSDPMEFIAMGIRSVTRNTGPIPLSKLTPLLADEFLETIGRQGMSLASFIEQYPNYLSAVHLPGPVIIAISAHLRRHFNTEEKRRLGMWVMALLSATHFLPGQPQVAAMGLSSPHPTIEELCQTLRIWTNMDVMQLEIFLRSLPELFSIHNANRRVRLLIVNAMTPNEPAMRSAVGGLAPRLKTVKEPESSKFALWLRTVVPSQFHVPVSFVLERARELNVLELAFGSSKPTLDQIKGQFQQLPSGFADIRAFGDATHTVFVRIIDPEPLLLESGVPTYGGVNAPPEFDAVRYNPTQLAQELTAAIEQYAGQSSLTLARVTKGLEMSRIREYIGVSLMRKLEHFYGFSDKDDPRVCILLLDRLRHLWEVELNAGTARPWACLPESEMPSSLTLQTSPSPRVLLHCQRLLVECGAQPLMDLYSVLPSDLKTVFIDLYSSPSGGTTEGAGSAPVVSSTVPNAPLPPSDARIASALQTFVRTHSLFFFMKGDCVHASRVIQPCDNDRVSPITEKEREVSRQQALPKPGGNRKREAKANKEKSLTDAEVAQVVYDTIPPDSWISADTLRSFLFLPREEIKAKKSRGLPVQTFRREFFERHHRLFDIHSLFAFDKLVVSRASWEVKEPHLLAPRIDNISRLIKLMALLSVDSISDASLTRRLPIEGRQLLKSIGAVTDIAEQLPMWFIVQRDEVNFGGSLIRYIGPLAKTQRSVHALKPHQKGVLTRKVPNDPFADIPPDNIQDGDLDGWNDDWNEEGGDLFSSSSKWDDDDGR